MSGPLEIRPLRSDADFRACVELQRLTWGERFSEVVPPALLWAVQQVGGVAAGAFEGDGRLAGFVFGFGGVRDGRLAHWSDLLAVRPELRGRGVGLALKRWQRDALLPLGVEAVYWTFDPLESRSAHLNFARLGVVARSYLRDVYGASDSPLHRGVGTDRILAEWAIASGRVARRLDGSECAPAAAEVADAVVVNPVRAAAAGPESAAPELGLDAPRLRITIPADLHRLRERDPALARDWRAKTRAALEAYLGRGYTVTELVREEEAVSSYLLERTALFS